VETCARYVLKIDGAVMTQVINFNTRQ